MRLTYHQTYIPGQLTMLARRVLGSSRPVRHCLYSTLCLRRPACLTGGRFEPPLCRIFVTTPRHRKDIARIPQPKSTIPPQTEPSKSKKPEVVKVKAAKPKQDILLAEQAVSNAQQRKADWAILKEMTAYLWPKVRIYKILNEKLVLSNSFKNDLNTRVRVGVALGLLIGAKVTTPTCFPISWYIDTHVSKFTLGPQCPNPILFQVHR